MASVVLVTGAASGIGRATAQYLTDHGLKVIGLDLLSAMDAIATGANFEIRALDVTRWDEIRALASDLEKRSLEIRGIVNNAALQVEKTVVETSEADLAKVFGTNVFSVFGFFSECRRLLARNASIVNVSSVHAHATSIGLAAYAASKGAMSALTRAMALECGEQGIRVNAVCPGAVDTEMLRRGLSRNAAPDTAMAKLKASSPLGRIGTPQDIAKMIHFLLDSDLSANITGQEFILDSGVLAKLASE